MLRDPSSKQVLLQAMWAHPWNIRLTFLLIHLSNVCCSRADHLIDLDDALSDQAGDVIGPSREVRDQQMPSFVIVWAVRVLSLVWSGALSVLGADSATKSSMLSAWVMAVEAIRCAFGMLSPILTDEFQGQGRLSGRCLFVSTVGWLLRVLNVVAELNAHVSRALSVLPTNRNRELRRMRLCRWHGAPRILAVVFLPAYLVSQRAHFIQILERLYVRLAFLATGVATIELVVSNGLVLLTSPFHWLFFKFLLLLGLLHPLRVWYAYFRLLYRALRRGIALWPRPNARTTVSLWLVKREDGLAFATQRFLELILTLIRIQVVEAEGAIILGPWFVVGNDPLAASPMSLTQCIFSRYGSQLAPHLSWWLCEVDAAWRALLGITLRRCFLFRAL